jgi:hypothetical protein
VIFTGTEVTVTEFDKLTSIPRSPGPIVSFVSGSTQSMTAWSMQCVTRTIRGIRVQVQDSTGTRNIV